MALYLYDDARARTFEPFALTRPTSEMRAGAVVVRHRWESAIGLRASGAIVAPHLQKFEELDSPGAASGSLPAGSIVANARCVPALGQLPRDVEVWICDGRVAAVRLARETAIDVFDDGLVTLEELAGAGGESEEIPGRWTDEVWHYLRDLSTQLTDDIGAIGPRLETGLPQGAIIIGDRLQLFVEAGANVEPLACFDMTAGPVLVLSGASVQAFSRVVGPCVIGAHSSVLGGRVSGCSIGDYCKVHGEISASIMLGHANKGHDGFVGHSYLGRWVNLGALTTTSNLKNTYGPVALWTPTGVRDSGMQFLGTLFGDHAKTGIGLRLTTGCVIGAGANVYDSMPPKAVAPFAWGAVAPYDTYDVERFLTVAERMMARRHVLLSDDARTQLRAAHAARWTVKS